jgi:NADPH-dependent 2,4-dienoyl-CoA reductase/sulfur reductase-like enzyme
MPAYKYFIIGGGLTGDAAARGIRSVDPSGPIGMVSQEIHPPYSRPALSKGLWRGKPYERIWQNTAALNVDLYLGRTITELDLANKRAIDDQKTVYTFEKLLLATGGTPRRLPFGKDDIIYFRTLVDYEKLKKLSEERQNFVVIGGGFIGSEIAAALAMHNKHVTMVFPEDGICARVFPHSMTIFLNDYYHQKGVEVMSGSRITGIESHGGSTTVKFLNQNSGAEREVIADGVVAGVGIQPNIELANAAGLVVENGILVDEYLRTSHPDVYAAGDVASFYSLVLKERMRVEHEDNALTMGMTAGKNMAGERTPYHHLPFFYSDLFDLGYEAVGELDARKEVVADWKEMYKKGVIYYMSGGQVRGVLLWNVWDQVENARRVIAEPGPFSPADLLNKIPM